MENILEIIFTIIVGFFWLFGSTLFKKREEDEYPEPTVSRKEKRQRGDQKSSNEEARQREIRESILRKISERRQQSEPEPAMSLEPQLQDQYQEPYSEPQEVVDEPFFYEESIKEEAAEVPFSWNTDETTYEQEMQERLKEIEATKRRAEALKKKAKQVAQNHYAIDRERSTQERQVLSVGSVRSSLKNPENLRAAFLYGEILGKPVGLRNSAESGLGV